MQAISRFAKLGGDRTGKLGREKWQHSFEEINKRADRLTHLLKDLLDQGGRDLSGHDTTTVLPSRSAFLRL
jgi:hypothetical protein